MASDYPPKFTTDAIEGNSALIEITITDVDGVTPIPGTSVSTAEMTLRDKTTGDIINSHGDPSPTDVKSSIDDNGRFRYTLDPEDNVIVSTSALTREEVHVLGLKVVANNGTKDITLDREILITVKNEKFKPAS